MSDREESPDWLREFEAPSSNFVALSSSSDSSPENSPRKVYSDLVLDEDKPHQKKKDSVPIDVEEDSPVKKTGKSKSLKTREDHGVDNDALGIHEKEPGEKNETDDHAAPSVSSRLPLMFPEKVNRSKALIECDGDSIDLSGDVGAVGRIVMSDGPSGSNEMLLDMKGTIYKSTIAPSRTFCIVSVGQSEAKIEAIMTDFIQLEPLSNVYEAETMVEGTLDGFSFDSDEEGVKVPKTSAPQGDADNENGERTPKKNKRQSEKPPAKANKKAKAAVRPSKTVKKTKKSKK